MNRDELLKMAKESGMGDKEAEAQVNEYLEAQAMRDELMLADAQTSINTRLAVIGLIEAVTDAIKRVKWEKITGSG